LTTCLFPLSWSISTEAFFYLAYMFAVFALLAIARPRNALVIAALFAAVAMSGILTAAVRFDTQGQLYRWLFYFSPYVRVFEFFMGCLAGHIFLLLRERAVSPRERCLGIGLVAAGLSFLIAFYFVRMGIVQLGYLNNAVNVLTSNFFFAPALAVLIFCACRYDTLYARTLSLPWIVALGEMSYSIYLVHTWTLRMFRERPPPVITWFWSIETGVRIVLAIAATLALSYACYHLIENPARRWLRRVLDAPSRAGVATPALQGRSTL
jgi:peptidoglycan/LPS O-acetylase OafA/YrhL